MADSWPSWLPPRLVAGLPAVTTFLSIGPTTGFSVLISSALHKLKFICCNHSVPLFSKAQHQNIRRARIGVCCVFMNGPIVLVSGGFYSLVCRGWEHSKQWINKFIFYPKLRDLVEISILVLWMAGIWLRFVWVEVVALELMSYLDTEFIFDHPGTFKMI